MSPVLDSVFTHWWLADAPVEATREPLAATIADVARAYRAPNALIAAARTLAHSFRGFYFVGAKRTTVSSTSRTSSRARLMLSA